jgi:hypothetical protein
MRSVASSPSLQETDAVGHAIDGGYLKPVDVRYELVPTTSGTRLSLTCEYTLRTTVTPSTHFVAAMVTGQFERDLLRALRARFEGRFRREAPLLLAEHRVLPQPASELRAAR